jgi:hypothetical protein
MIVVRVETLATSRIRESRYSSAAGLATGSGGHRTRPEPRTARPSPGRRRPARLDLLDPLTATTGKALPLAEMAVGARLDVASLGVAERGASRHRLRIPCGTIVINAAQAMEPTRRRPDCRSRYGIDGLTRRRSPNTLTTLSTDRSLGRVQIRLVIAVGEALGQRWNGMLGSAPRFCALSARCSSSPR